MKKPNPEIKDYSERNLHVMIQFQREYPGLFVNLQPVVADLLEASTAGRIRPQVVAKFETKGSTQLAQGSGETQIRQQAVAQLHWAHNDILSQKLKGNDFFL